MRHFAAVMDAFSDQQEVLQQLRRNVPRCRVVLLLLKRAPKDPREKNHRKGRRMPECALMLRVDGQLIQGLIRRRAITHRLQYGKEARELRCPAVGRRQPVPRHVPYRHAPHVPFIFIHLDTSKQRKGHCTKQILVQRPFVLQYFSLKNSDTGRPIQRGGSSRGPCRPRWRCRGCARPCSGRCGHAGSRGCGSA